MTDSFIALILNGNYQGFDISIFLTISFVYSRGRNNLSFLISFWDLVLISFFDDFQAEWANDFLEGDLSNLSYTKASISFSRLL